MPRSLFLLLLLAPLSCASPTELLPDEAALANRVTIEGVTLSIAEGTYSYGDVAVLHLVNASSVTIGYNYCMAAWEHWDGARWVRFESFRLCLAMMYGLEAGGRTSFNEEITQEWQPGRYRIILRIHHPDRSDPFDLATGPFEITP